MSTPTIIISNDGRDVRVTVEPRRCDMPSFWNRDPAKALAYADHLSREHGWPIRDEREATNG